MSHIKIILNLFKNSPNNFKYNITRQYIYCQKRTWKIEKASFVEHTKFYSTKNQNPSQIMTDILKKRFPLAKQIDVVDISGGCGAMYEITVESIEFKGLPIVKQHRLINDLLKEQIKDMHGLRIQTSVPAENG